MANHGYRLQRYGVTSQRSTEEQCRSCGKIRQGKSLAADSWDHCKPQARTMAQATSGGVYPRRPDRRGKPDGSLQSGLRNAGSSITPARKLLTANCSHTSQKCADPTHSAKCGYFVGVPFFLAGVIMPKGRELKRDGSLAFTQQALAPPRDHGLRRLSSQRFSRCRSCPASAGWAAQQLP